MTTRAGDAGILTLRCGTTGGGFFLPPPALPFATPLSGPSFFSSAADSTGFGSFGVGLAFFGSVDFWLACFASEIFWLARFFSVLSTVAAPELVGCGVVDGDGCFSAFTFVDERFFDDRSCESLAAEPFKLVDGVCSPFEIGDSPGEFETVDWEAGSVGVDVRGLGVRSG